MIPILHVYLRQCVAIASPCSNVPPTQTHALETPRTPLAPFTPTRTPRTQASIASKTLAEPPAIAGLHHLAYNSPHADRRLRSCARLLAPPPVLLYTTARLQNPTNFAYTGCCLHARHATLPITNQRHSPIRPRSLSRYAIRQASPALPARPAPHILNLTHTEPLPAAA